MQRSGLIATKIGNSSFFQNDGTNTHVTILKVDECVVSNIKTTEKGMKGKINCDSPVWKNRPRCNK